MKIYQLFSKPHSWIKGEYARVSLRGDPVDPRDKTAKCFCLDGAIQRCYNGRKYLTVRDKLESFIEEKFPRSFRGSLEDFNDYNRNASRKAIVAICKELNV